MNRLSGFKKAFEATKEELLLSMMVVLVLTVLLSVVFYFVERVAQPEVYTCYTDALVWAYTRYIEGGDGVFEGSPVTVVGKVIASLFGFIGIAIVAIPAGLIGSGFMDAIAEERRMKELADARERLKKAFRHKQCRYTKLRTTPAYLPMTTIQAKQQMDTKDIIDAVRTSDCFRLRNLADTQNCSEHPNDRLVVERFERTEDCPYGCWIDRNSNVTIVSPSSVNEAGISNFAYYVAEIGGFNFVSKEYEVDTDNPVSFYVVDNPEDETSNCKRFIDDLKSLSCGKDKWVIFFISASGAEEPAYPTDFHFIYGAKKGDEGYTDPNLTIMNTDKFDGFYSALAGRLESDFDYLSDKHRFHTGAGKKNIARRINGGVETNAFTIRASFKVTVWDDRRIAVAKTIAESIQGQLNSTSN